MRSSELREDAEIAPFRCGLRSVGFKHELWNTNVHKGQEKFRFGNTGYRNRTRLRFGFVTTIHSAPEQSATRERTRKAILDAAVSVFASKPAATLSEIASAARVGRTTLHRYFPERSDLVDAVAAEATRAVGEAAAAARLGEGTGAKHWFACAMNTSNWPTS